MMDRPIRQAQHAAVGELETILRRHQTAIGDEISVPKTTPGRGRERAAGGSSARPFSGGRPMWNRCESGRPA
jgi:hypothetical protein